MNSLIQDNILDIIGQIHYEVGFLVSVSVFGKAEKGKLVRMWSSIKWTNISLLVHFKQYYD